MKKRLLCDKIDLKCEHCLEGEFLMRLQVIEVSDISYKEDDQRRHISEEGIERLMDSFKEVGMLHPLIVKKTKEDNYRLVAGRRRLIAAKRLGVKKVTVAVLNDEGSSENQVRLIENLQREDLDPVERAITLSEYMDTEKLSKRAVAQKLGIPRTTLTEWLNILEVGEGYQKLILDNYNGGDSPLTISHIGIAKGLANVLGDRSRQSELLNAVINHRLTKREAREVADYIKEHPQLSIEDALKTEEVPIKKDEDEKGPSIEEVRRLKKELDGCLAELQSIIIEAKHFITTDSKEELLSELLEMHRAIEKAVSLNYQMPISEAMKLIKKRELKQVL